MVKLTGSVNSWRFADNCGLPMKQNSWSYHMIISPAYTMLERNQSNKNDQSISEQNNKNSGSQLNLQQFVWALSSQKVTQFTN